MERLKQPEIDQQSFARSSLKQLAEFCALEPEAVGVRVESALELELCVSCPVRAETAVGAGSCEADAPGVDTKPELPDDVRTLCGFTSVT